MATTTIEQEETRTNFVYRNKANKAEDRENKLATHRRNERDGKTFIRMNVYSYYPHHSKIEIVTRSGAEAIESRP